MAKFSMGQQVTVKDRGDGVVVEVGVHDDHWFKNGHEQLYGVRLSARALKEDGSLADHMHDTLGCVPESDLS